MTAKSKSSTDTLYLETFPKVVRRALKSVGADLRDVDVHASVASNGEHGKTTVTYTHALDEQQHGVVQNAIVKAANREHEAFLADDEEDA